jgi:hypothetical protein
MRDYLQERTKVLARTMTGPDAEAHAALIVSSILGITVARHFLDLAPLAGADESTVSRLLEGWLAALD